MEQKSYEKVFRSGLFSITRAEYAELSCAMIAEEMTDEQMQKIVEDIDAHMRSIYTMHELEWLDKYRKGKRLSKEKAFIASRMSEQEFEYFETCATANGMRYWEDLSKEEYEQLKNKWL